MWARFTAKQHHRNSFTNAVISSDYRLLLLCLSVAILVSGAHAVSFFLPRVANLCSYELHLQTADCWQWKVKSCCVQSLFCLFLVLRRTTSKRLLVVGVSGLGSFSSRRVLGFTCWKIAENSKQFLVKLFMVQRLFLVVVVVVGGGLCLIFFALLITCNVLWGGVMTSVHMVMGCSAVWLYICQAVLFICYKITKTMHRNAESVCACLCACRTWENLALLFVAAFVGCQMFSGCVRHLISYSRLWHEKLFSLVCKNPPSSLAFIKFGQGSIESMWQSSAPLSIVQHCSKVVIFRDRRLILVWLHPRALCRLVNCKWKNNSHWLQK